MPSRYVALDIVTGSQGVVVGIGATDAALDAAGFTAAAGYTGDRRLTVDDSTPAWDADVDIGWYWDGSALTETPVLTPLDDLKATAHTMLSVGDAVRAEITRLAPGQDETLVAHAHNWMWRARGGSYLTLLNRGLTIAERKAWALANAQGPTDITGSTLTERVLNYFTHFTGESAANWITFARPSDAARQTLANAIRVTGTIADTVDLVDRTWVDQILPGSSE